MHFQRNRYVLNRSPNVSTKFGEDRSNSKKYGSSISISQMEAAAVLNYGYVDFCDLTDVI